MSGLRKWLTENWALKLLALVLGFAFWAAFEGASNTEMLVTVPVEFLNVPPDMILSAYPTEVQMRLRGPRTVLRNTPLADFHVQMDLATLRGTDQQVLALSPGMAEVPAGVEVVQINPREMVLSLVPSAASHSVP